MTKEQLFTFSVSLASAVIVALITSWFTQHRERKSFLRDRKREQLESLTNCFADCYGFVLEVRNGIEPTTDRFARLSGLLELRASAEIVRAFHRARVGVAGGESVLDSGKSMQALAELMRRQLAELEADLRET